MNTKLFSVVICTYNRADLLTDVLQTICNQTLVSTDYEVLIVDNKSTDETAMISAYLSQRDIDTYLTSEVEDTARELVFER